MSTVRECDGNGYTLLHEACNLASDRRDVCEVVRRLLDTGAEVDARNEFGTTPLMLAAQGGHTDACEVLLARGAAVNVQNEHGQTALWCALFFDRADVARVLLLHGATVPQYHKEHAWFIAMLQNREVCRTATVTWLLSAREQLGHDMARIIGQQLWMTRFDTEVWQHFSDPHKR